MVLHKGGEIGEHRLDILDEMSIDISQNAFCPRTIERSLSFLITSRSTALMFVAYVFSVSYSSITIRL